MVVLRYRRRAIPLAVGPCLAPKGSHLLRLTAVHFFSNTVIHPFHTQANGMADQH